MESSSNRSHKRNSSSSKGFLKGKLQSMSLLHKPTTSKPLPSSASTTNTVTNLKPSLIHHDALPLPAAANHIMNPHPQGGRVAIKVHQDQSLPQPTHRLSIHVLSIPEKNNNESSTKHVDGKFDHHHHHHYHHHPVDENVDLKATDYISSVKERFRVPMLNS